MPLHRTPDRRCVDRGVCRLPARSNKYGAGHGHCECSGDHDDNSFLRDQIALLERDVYAKATKLFALSLWKMLPGMIEDLQDIGCLRVARCGHKFSSMPLLYTARFADSGATHTSISVKMCRVTSRSHCGRFFVYCAPLCARET